MTQLENRWRALCTVSGIIANEIFIAFRFEWSVAMYRNFEIHFERAMQLFLGNKADFIATQVLDKNLRKTWYKSALKKALKTIHEIETSTTHKKQLASLAESALNEVETRCDENEILLYLFQLAGVLLGFHGERGSVLYTPIYSQNAQQHYTEEILRGGNNMQDEDEKSSVAIRQDLVLNLKSQGLSDFKIGQVLNITEYQVKKLRKNI